MGANNELSFIYFPTSPARKCEATYSKSILMVHCHLEYWILQAFSVTSRHFVWMGAGYWNTTQFACIWSNPSKCSLPPSQQILPFKIYHHLALPAATSLDGSKASTQLSGNLELFCLMY